jgi:hypothetical protein
MDLVDLVQGGQGGRERRKQQPVASAMVVVNLKERVEYCPFGA